VPAKSTRDSRDVAAPGVESGDAGGATDRSAYRAVPAALEKTVLVKPKPESMITR
jgi:hypothetical protein